MPSRESPFAEEPIDSDLPVVWPTPSESQKQESVEPITRSISRGWSATTGGFAPPEYSEQSPGWTAPSPSTPHRFHSCLLRMTTCYTRVRARHVSNSDGTPEQCVGADPEQRATTHSDSSLSKYSKSNQQSTKPQTSNGFGAAMRMHKQRLRIGGMMRPLFSQQRIRRHEPVNFSIVRRRPAWAFRERLSTSFKRTTSEWRGTWRTFERVLCIGVQLLILGNFFNNFLNNYIIVNANITRIHFNMIVTRYSRDFNRFLRRSLRIRRLSCRVP